MWRWRSTWLTTRPATNGRSWVTLLRRTLSITRVVLSRIQTLRSRSHWDASLRSTTTWSCCRAFCSHFSLLSYSGCRPSRRPRWCSVCHLLSQQLHNAQYTPPTPTRRNCFVASASAVWTRIRNYLATVLSCRQCEHTRRQSWPSLQFPDFLCWQVTT